MAPALNHLIGELTRLATSLYEFLLRTERNPERPGWRDQIERYGKATVHLRLMAQNVEMQGIAQAAILQQDFLRALLHAEDAPSPRDWDAMERWPLLLLSCLATPLTYAAIDELVAYYRSHLPADEFDENAIQSLRLGFASRVDPSSARPTAQVVRLPTSAQRRDIAAAALKFEPSSDHVRYLLQHELLEAIAEYYVFCTANRRDVPALCHALRLCADRVQLLGISAAGSGMIGLMDCCLLCHDALAQRANRGEPFSELENEQLKTWSGLVSRYLEAPHNEAVSEALVAMHQVTPWLPRLSYEEYDGIREFLKEDTSDEKSPEPIAPAPIRERGASAQVVPWPGETHPRFAPAVQKQTEAVEGNVDSESKATLPAEEALTEVVAETPAKETHLSEEIDTPAIAPDSPADFTATAESPAAEIATLMPSIESIAASIDSTWSDEARQLMRIIADELEASAPAVESLVTMAKTTSIETDAHAEAVADLETLLNRLIGATRAAGLVGVATALDILMRNHCGISDGSVPPAKAFAALRAAPALLAAYCRAPQDASQRDAVVAVVRMAAWRTAPQARQLDALEAALLMAPELPEDDSPPRPTQARPDDVALTIPSDANPRLVETLLQELPQRTSDFSACVQRLRRADATAEDVIAAQRHAHTLKGAANTVGVAGIANLTHHIEDVLQEYLNQKRIPTGNVLTLLQHGADLLEAMCESLLKGGSTPEEAVTVLQDVLDVANQIDREGLPVVEPNVPAEVPAVTVTSPAATAEPAPATMPTEPPALVSEHATAMLRVPANLIDELLRLAGESIIVGGQLREQLKHAARQTALAAEQHAHVIQRMDQLEHLVDTRGMSVTNTAPVETRVLDSLELDHFNEMHTLARQLAEAATDARELTQSIEPCIAQSQELLAAQNRLQRDVRDSVLRARMVPVTSIIPRLQRAVRQTCRLTSKEAELNVSGDETLIDGDILEKIADPLMHLLRNAIDHGIEPVAVRSELGKETIGRLNLSISRDGDHVVLQLSDDGAGVDIARVRDLAVERNLLHEESIATEEDLFRILLLPGFTTRSTSSQTSGRGIGLDAVHGIIAQLKGSMHISSLAGQGCTVELRVPLTLISVHCLIVKMHDQLVAVSSRGVERILYSGSGSVQIEDHRLSFRVENETYDAFELGELLRNPVDRHWVEKTDRPALLVRDVSSRWCVVFVEQVLASQELVIKPLGPYIARPLGVEGATILGNGSVVPVMDLNGLIQAARAMEAEPTYVATPGDSSEAQRPLVMVVDDSPSARRNLSEYLRDLGFDVVSAVDGLDAVEAMKQRPPQLVIADLEMPRMNGLELATLIRESDDLASIPFIMLTSRSTQKHRELAAEAGVDLYLTKPFSDDKLVDHIHQLLRKRSAETSVAEATE